MRRTNFIFLFLFCFTANALWAADNPLTIAEDEIQELMMQMREEQSDGDRDILNEELKTKIRQTLKIKGAYTFPFDSLANTMSTLAAPDGAFRIFNWNVANNDRTHQYFCFVMYFDKKDKVYRVDELRDQSEFADDEIENRVLFQTHWYGALYYDIIVSKKGKKRYYTMLGWKGYDRFVTQRVMEVLFFQGSNQIKFGAPIFKMENKMKRRVIFQYSEEARMSIKYHQKLGWIVFDHLSTTSGILSGHPEANGPDLSFDCFEWQKTKWVFKSNIDINGQRNQNDRRYRVPIGTPYGSDDL